jgi:hypothetical protein
LSESLPEFLVAIDQAPNAAKASRGKWRPAFPDRPRRRGGLSEGIVAMSTPMNWLRATADCSSAHAAMTTVLLIVAGLILSFTPGQGILTLLLGISLPDIPGKQALERKIVQRPPVLKLVNRMRARANQPPLSFS